MQPTLSTSLLNRVAFTLVPSIVVTPISATYTFLFENTICCYCYSCFSQTATPILAEATTPILVKVATHVSARAITHVPIKDATPVLVKVATLVLVESTTLVLVKIDTAILFQVVTLVTGCSCSLKYITDHFPSRF